MYEDSSQTQSRWWELPSAQPRFLSNAELRWQRVRDGLLDLRDWTRIALLLGFIVYLLSAIPERLTVILH